MICDPAARLHSALNFHDLRRLAKRRLPKGIFEYIDRGTEDETAIRHTRASFDGLRVAPKAPVTGEVSLKTTLFGQKYAAPTAFTGLVWHRGEIALAKACSTAGIGYCAASCMSASKRAMAGIAVSSPTIRYRPAGAILPPLGADMPKTSLALACITREDAGPP